MVFPLLLITITKTIFVGLKKIKLYFFEIPNTVNLDFEYNLSSKSANLFSNLDTSFVSIIFCSKIIFFFLLVSYSALLGVLFSQHGMNFLIYLS